MMRPLILAIEPDRRQALRLASMARRLPAELVLADSADRALAELRDPLPDLILTPQLLSRRDDLALTDRLRELGDAAAHIQTLTIPIFEKPVSPARRGVLAALRRKKAPAEALAGCDIDTFAEQIRVYLKHAAEARRVRPEPDATEALPVVTDPTTPSPLPGAESVTEPTFEMLDLAFDRAFVRDGTAGEIFTPDPVEDSTLKVVELHVESHSVGDAGDDGLSMLPDVATSDANGNPGVGPLAETIMSGDPEQRAPDEIVAPVPIEFLPDPEPADLPVRPAVIEAAGEPPFVQPLSHTVLIPENEMPVATAPGAPVQEPMPELRPEAALADSDRGGAAVVPIPVADAETPVEVTPAALSAASGIGSPGAPIATRGRGREDRRSRRKPAASRGATISDDWNYFDPQQCPLAVLIAKLDEVAAESQAAFAAKLDELAAQSRAALEAKLDRMTAR